MIEYFGWASISESLDEKNESDQAMSVIWENLQRKINATFADNTNPQFQLKMMNGVYHFMISGFHNHKSQDFFDVVEIFQWLASHAIGSYGLLHFFDDEDKNGFNNQFQVYRLKQGNFERQNDTFFSPYFNEVEIRETK